MTDGKPQVPEPELRGARRRRVAAGLLVACAFVAVVVVTSIKSLVPVGASDSASGGSMPAMKMGGDRLMLTMRDVDGRTLRIPSGRAGIALFGQAGGCEECIRGARAGLRAVARAGRGAQLLVVMVEGATTRSEVKTFERSVGGAGARYVIDDRNGSLASGFDATGYTRAVVFDGRGRIVGRPRTGERELTRVLRRATERAGRGASR